MGSPIISLDFSKVNLKGGAARMFRNCGWDLYFWKEYREQGSKFELRKIFDRDVEATEILASTLGNDGDV